MEVITSQRITSQRITSHNYAKKKKIPLGLQNRRLGRISPGVSRETPMSQKIIASQVSLSVGAGRKVQHLAGRN